MCYSPYYGQPILKSIRMIEELAKKNCVNFLNYGGRGTFPETGVFSRCKSFE